MKMIDNIKERFHQLQANNGSSALTQIEQNAFNTFNNLGIPTVKHEEWKYTRISSFFNKDYNFAQQQIQPNLTTSELNQFRLPGYEDANEIVFINGIYSSSLSVIRSSSLQILSLEEAANHEHKNAVATHFNQSSKYLQDGINALNTAFAQEGIFIHVKKGKVVEHPVYIYHITDARTTHVLSQPRGLVHIEENAQVLFAETYGTIGVAESFTNQVLEIVVEKDAVVDYYKVQNDKSSSSHVSTTHFRQVGKSVVNAVTISVDGGVIRNNLNVVLEAERCEANLYGLYFIKGNTHVDNHTIVDNVKPNCLSNELYKGIIDDNATAVFNGKIYVQQDAQKTNAFQSNKNILLSDNATVNTKPQLEIFADDVKCSHGCTIGQLDEEGMFYLRSRGISEKTAKSLLVHAFAIDILDHIKSEPIRSYVNGIISERLEFEFV